MQFHSTHHAEIRMNQRSFRPEDVDLILAAGDQIGPDAFMMSREVTDREIARRKREIQRLEHLKGKKIIVSGGMIITAYHTTQREEKRTFRIGRDRA